MKQVRIDISEINITLKKNYIDPRVISDHEIRIRRLERWGFVAIGGLGLIQILGFGWIMSQLLN